jgi:hypothetical protein
MKAALAGYDRLQRRSRGSVSPDSFTHGASAQRMHWFKLRLQNGNIGQCNTLQTADRRP